MYTTECSAINLSFQSVFILLQLCQCWLCFPKIPPSHTATSGYSAAFRKRFRIIFKCTEIFVQVRLLNWVSTAVSSSLHLEMSIQRRAHRRGACCVGLFLSSFSSTAPFRVIGSICVFCFSVYPLEAPRKALP